MKKTSSIQITELSKPRAFASRATQMSSATLKTKAATTIPTMTKRPKPHAAQPPAPDGSE